MTQQQNVKHPIHTLIDMKTSVYNMKQQTLCDNEYYEKFKETVANADQAGEAIVEHPERTNSMLCSIARDIQAPTDEEQRMARARATDEHLAILFLINSDRKRYGNLISNIENEHIHGTNSYSTSLTGAYNYLVNYKAERQTSLPILDEGGVAFTVNTKH